MTFRITREQLYELVSSESMQHLSKQIGISDVAIAKHCRNLGVPTPKRGYRAELHAGKKVERKPLLHLSGRDRAENESPFHSMAPKKASGTGSTRLQLAAGIVDALRSCVSVRTGLRAAARQQFFRGGESFFGFPPS